ncbi:LysR family transcriptional regulator [Pantoea sp. ACRSB]|uniref:LysR family transcriptional regulator n=1 Tax=Pantoea sp. ACRSB TaxID=2918207 RepID=UPI002892E7C8|nr:LysR family transcriptional regulator [Pantoea sp. ACRSB]MCG7389859.1 LysR family transcriptional regulator [Pantoea sp. ACRSB]
MDVKQLRYFIALSEERHYGRAADRLHITQPPLTRSIQALEKSLETRLFERNSKGVALTPAGYVLLEKARTIVSMTQDAAEQTRLAGKGFLGRLDVGIFSSGIFNVIPQLLGEFHQARPGVKISLHSMSKAEQLAALREKRIDIGFNRLVPKEPDIAVEWVRREPYIVAIYEDHPLAKKSVIHLADLDSVPMILYPNTPMYGLMQLVSDAFRHEGVSLNIEQAVDDVMTAMALVACRFGICITTESAANVNPQGVVYRPLLSLELQDIELSCLYRKSDDSPVLMAFLKLLRQRRRSLSV